ncbi:MAG: ParA family protein [Myxococcales bacterium]|nr:ParA family protein [Myxococcales bacterium]
MTVLAIVSPKGGCGKTTVALNLSLAFARRGWSTLLVDTDPQGAVGLSLTRRVADARGLAEYVAHRRPLGEVVIATRLENLAILPIGHIAIQDTPGFHAALADGAALGRLVEEAAAAYHLVIFDTPSGFGGATVGALRAATHVLCPVQAEPLASRSVTQVFEVLAWLRDNEVAVEPVGLLLTMLQLREKDSLEAAETVWGGFPEELVLEPAVPRDPAFLAASSAGVPVGLLSRRPPPVAMVFDKLAAELEQRMRLTEKEPDDGPVALVD